MPSRNSLPKLANSALRWSITGASIARKIRSGTFVGPGIWRKWRPVWIMAAPCDIETKLYLLDAAERNLRQCVQVDEIAGRGVRMIKSILGGILSQPGSVRRRPIGRWSVS